MKITSPAADTKFQIGTDATWPSIVFQTDGTGSHSWAWKISWNTFNKNGTAITPGNQWDAQTVVTNMGGTLTVTATAGGQSATVSVKITGQNPTTQQATTYLTAQPNSDGFDKLLEHESHFKHFNASGEPIKSFDNGYGMAQLTSPAPSYEQVWNWKSNIDGGLTLFGQKRAAALTYLTQSNRTYTSDQLKYEAVCRWNGGSYHTWDGTKWVRNADILCDAATGNIGWDMTDSENTGKTAADLHKRDKDTYSRRPSDAHWKYLGVCYADAVLG